MPQIPCTASRRSRPCHVLPDVNTRAETRSNTKRTHQNVSKAVRIHKPNSQLRYTESGVHKHPQIHVDGPTGDSSAPRRRPSTPDTRDTRKTEVRELWSTRRRQRGAARSYGGSWARTVPAGRGRTCTSTQPALHRAQLHGLASAKLLHGLAAGTDPRAKRACAPSYACRGPAS